MDTGIELAVETAAAHGAPATDVERSPQRAEACTVVRLAGVLDPGSAPGLTTALREALRAHGTVVADVSALRAEHTPAVRAFTDALTDAGEWPDIRLAVGAPDARLAALLLSSQVGLRLVVADDVAAAIRAVVHRPDLVCAHWDFEVSSHAPGAARAHVRRVCDRWTVDVEVCEAAEIVVTELVTNAVEHASSRSEVAVERRADSFRMTVRDYDTAPLPDVVLPPPSSSRGRGLAMVAAVSSRWGVDRHDDGKTVWVEMATA